MTLLTKNDTDLTEFILSDQAASLLSKHIEIEDVCDDYYRVILDKIHRCTYLEENCNPNLSCKFFENSLMLMHINIRFLNKNFDNLYNLFSFRKFSPSIVVISETRLKNLPLTNISMPGNSFVYVDSESNAGGVAAYISNSIQFQLQKKKQFYLHKYESIWLTAYNNKTKCIVGIIYRHPTLTKIDKFLDNISACLSDSTSSNQTVYLAGDININFDNLNRTKLADNYVNILLSKGFLTLITIPTRVTATSSTIIDHMTINDLKHKLISFVVKSLIADHYMTICCVKKFENCPKNVKKKIFIRDKNNLNNKKFTSYLKSNLLNCV